jgi:hypothetical protein
VTAMEPEFVTREQAQELANTLKLTNESAPEEVSEEVHQFVNSAGRFYHKLRQRELAEQQHRERSCADLDELRELLGDALERLEGVSDIARRRLGIALERMPLPPTTAFKVSLRVHKNEDEDEPPTTLQTCLVYLRHLQDAVERAYHSFHDRGGHPGLLELRWLCAELVEFYEHLTDRRFTYGAHHVDGKLSGFTTEGTCWVQDVVKLVDPDVTAENLSTVLRELTRAKRQPE